MNDPVKRIADEAREGLNSLRKRIESEAQSAAAIVLEASRNLDFVVGVAKDFPEKLLSKYVAAATGEAKVEDREIELFDTRLVLNQYQYRLAGLFGSKLPQGRYRVLVLVERVE